MVGHCELIFGSMYCGKSEELLRRLKRSQIGGQKTILFKPSIDKRYGNNIVATHSAYSSQVKVEKMARDMGMKYPDEIKAYFDNDSKIKGEK